MLRIKWTADYTKLKGRRFFSIKILYVFHFHSACCMSLPFNLCWNDCTDNIKRTEFCGPVVTSPFPQPRGLWFKSRSEKPVILTELTLFVTHHCASLKKVLYYPSDTIIHICEHTILYSSIMGYMSRHFLCHHQILVYIKNYIKQNVYKG